MNTQNHPLRRSESKFLRGLLSWFKEFYPSSSKDALYGILCDRFLGHPTFTQLIKFSWALYIPTCSN